MFWHRPIFASPTCRSPASPRSCSQISIACAIPVAPTGCPLDLSPPLVLTGIRPPRAVNPAAAASPPRPRSTRPSASMQQISAIEKQSWTSATWIFAGPDTRHP